MILSSRVTIIKMNIKDSSVKLLWVHALPLLHEVTSSPRVKVTHRTREELDTVRASHVTCNILLLFVISGWEPNTRFPCYSSTIYTAVFSLVLRWNAVFHHINKISHNYRWKRRGYDGSIPQGDWLHYFLRFSVLWSTWYFIYFHIPHFPASFYFLKSIKWPYKFATIYFFFILSFLYLSNFFWK